MKWDEWDQILLRNSKSRIKKLFKSYYNDRDFEYEEETLRGPGQIRMNQLREALKMPSGQRILPKWRRRKIRSNPFNADGELCENED